MNRIMFHLIHQPLFQNAEHAFREYYYYKEGNWGKSWGKQLLFCSFLKCVYGKYRPKKKK